MGQRTEGRIILSSVRNAKKTPADYYWLITRGGNGITGFVHVKALAPNRELFARYLREWKGRPASEWWEKYKQQFIIQLGNEPARQYLKLLRQLVRTNHSVVLACFCADETHCHRSIIGEVLRQHGVQVISYSDSAKGDNTSQAVVIQQFPLF